MKKFFAIGAASAALAMSSSASTQVATDEASDVECLAATLIISQNAEQPVADQAMSAVMYFIGKIQARGLDYTLALETALREMTNIGLDRATARCEAELQFVATDMQRRGDEIEAREQLELREGMPAE
ncbi:hypothetical protein [Parasphingopyxis marina]|uniref:Uncharacterized protein n=1 Tax=Parasphingopyxis marina TaxID=2761622 RepID=A0A842I1N6_9SPHN|nr:hypothetical protein [Parasphingopyxis marina]MBC2779075.1 hypothetical protein [Parasphingopyxis marina]